MNKGEEKKRIFLQFIMIMSDYEIIYDKTEENKIKKIEYKKETIKEFKKEEGKKEEEEYMKNVMKDMMMEMEEEKGEIK